MQYRWHKESLDHVDSVMQEADDKRKKAIKKIVDKEDKARAPVLKRVGPKPAEYMAGLRDSVRNLSEQLASLNKS
jgi:hypothetical protein